MSPALPWRANSQTVGVYRILDEGMARLASRSPSALPNLRSSATLLVTSDYSGEHAAATYQVLSVLVASLEGVVGPWDASRRALRAAMIPDRRRMSFKDMRDGVRRRALRPFLEAAGVLPGLSFTMAIHRNVGTLFEGSAPLDLNSPAFAEFRSWTPGALEKAFRVVHLVSFLLGGLTSPGQNVLWYSDEDAIAANPERLGQLTNLTAWISSSMYLPHCLGHLRCGTTKSDDGTLLLEDTVSIPDAVAGAVAEQFQIFADEQEFQERFSKVFWMSRGGLSTKTSDISWWLATTAHELKRVVCRVDPIAGGGPPRVSWWHFGEPHRTG